jgi:hypothetical protein
MFSAKSVFESAMGCVTSASQGNIEEPMPKAMRGIESVQMSREQLLFQPRTEAACCSAQQNVWALTATSTRLQRSYEERMEVEEDHRNDLQKLEVANKELQEEHGAEMKQRHGREKKVERNKLLKNDLRILKRCHTRLQRDLDTKVKELQAVKRDLDTKVKIEEDLREELQAIEVANKKLQEEHYAETEQRHRREKKTLVERNKLLENDLRILKRRCTRLMRDTDTKVNIEEKLKEELRAVKRDLDTKVSIGEKLKEELQAIKVANKKMQEEHYAEMEQRHRREKKTLVECNKLLENDLRILKRRCTRLTRDLDTKVNTEEELQAVKRDLDTRVNIEEELREQLQAVKRDLDTKVKSEEELREELQAVKRDLDTKVKIEEGLREELQAVKNRVAADNMQLAGNSCGPVGKQPTQRGGISDAAVAAMYRFYYIRDLGQGSFGTVFLAKRKVQGAPEQLYAIKVIKKNQCTKLSRMRQLVTEKEALILARAHPFIVTLHFWFENVTDVFFVMDYVNGGDLRQQLHKLHVFSERRTQLYAAEIILALQFLHKHGIVHRDIKLENVLVGSDGHCKVTDFGLAKLGLFRCGRTKTYCGTPYCMAPEMVLNLPYGQAVDWWALGVMIYEMLVGHPPFYSKGNIPGQLNDRIVRSEVDYPDSMSPAAASLLRKLLEKDPEKRMGADGSVDTIRRHPFFTGLDWVALQQKTGGTTGETSKDSRRN